VKNQRKPAVVNFSSGIAACYDSVNGQPGAFAMAVGNFVKNTKVLVVASAPDASGPQSTLYSCNDDLATMPDILNVGATQSKDEHVADGSGSCFNMFAPGDGSDAASSEDDF